MPRRQVKPRLLSGRANRQTFFFSARTSLLTTPQGVSYLDKGGCGNTKRIECAGDLALSPFFAHNLAAIGSSAVRGQTLTGESALNQDPTSIHPRGRVCSFLGTFQASCRISTQMTRCSAERRLLGWNCRQSHSSPAATGCPATAALLSGRKSPADAAQGAGFLWTMTGAPRRIKR